jgi:hypothetical protein
VVAYRLATKWLWGGSDVAWMWLGGGSAVPVLADSMISDLPDDKTKAIGRIENALSE